MFFNPEYTDTIYDGYNVGYRYSVTRHVQLRAYFGSRFFLVRGFDRRTRWYWGLPRATKRYNMEAAFLQHWADTQQAAHE